MAVSFLTTSGVLDLRLAGIGGWLDEGLSDGAFVAYEGLCAG